MWTKRRSFSAASLGTYSGSHSPATTQKYLQQRDSAEAVAALTVAEDEFNFIASLGYVLIPTLTTDEARRLLPWVMARWMPKTATAAAAGGFSDPIEVLAADGAVCAALSQIEYFFLGTDNGQLFAVPLAPTHFLALVAERHGARFPSLVADMALEGREGGAATATLKCGLRMLLHRHMREEPVTAQDRCGTLVASAASEDPTALVSLYHPRAVPVARVPNAGRTIRSLKLWEGTPLCGGDPVAVRAEAEGPQQQQQQQQRRRWQQLLDEREPAAVYLFVGEDKDAVVRLYRLNVMEGTHALLHVFVVSPNMTGVASPLASLDHDDHSRRATQRETGVAVHCLAVDEDARLLAGMEGGICVWALKDLPYTPTDLQDTAPAAAADPLGSALCWDRDERRPMTGALLANEEMLRAAAGTPASGDAAADAEEDGALVAAATACVRRRAVRLVNQHVWIREWGFLQQQLKKGVDAEEGAPVDGDGGGVTAKKERSKCRIKYRDAVAGGAAVGVVSNEVAVAERATAAAAAVSLVELLEHTIVTVSFDGGELRNDLNVPLSCVVPAVYPLDFLRMPGNACFALAVLQPGRRIVSSGSDGRVAVWFRDGEDAAAADSRAYVPHLVAGRAYEGHRGIGRHVCVVRSPDVFLSCGFDDGTVREWHVYDEPERMLRCERRFTMLPSDGSPDSGGQANALKGLTDAIAGAPKDGEAKTAGAADDASSSEASDEEPGEPYEGVSGISCAVAFPLFGAVFLVGVFEPVVQTFSIVEVQGCEAPPGYIYNGNKTVKVPKYAHAATDC